MTIFAPEALAVFAQTSAALQLLGNWRRKSKGNARALIMELEVLMTDSTLRQGEPATWGSGQQKLNLSEETWALSRGRLRTLMQSKEKSSHRNEIRNDSNKPYSTLKEHLML